MRHDHLTLTVREFCVPQSTNESDRFIAIRVNDESLQPVVKEGDYAIVRITPQINETDLVAVYTIEGWFVRFVRSFAPRHVRLETVNRDYPDLHFALSDVLIVGVMVGTCNDKNLNHPIAEKATPMNLTDSQPTD